MQITPVDMSYFLLYAVKKVSYTQYTTVNIILKYRHAALMHLVCMVLAYCPDHA